MASSLHIVYNSKEEKEIENSLAQLKIYDEGDPLENITMSYILCNKVLT